MEPQSDFYWLVTFIELSHGHLCPPMARWFSGSEHCSAKSDLPCARGMDLQCGVICFYTLSVFSTFWEQELQVINLLSFRRRKARFLFVSWFKTASSRTAALSSCLWEEPSWYGRGISPWSWCKLGQYRRKQSNTTDSGSPRGMWLTASWFMGGASRNITG